jgi:hypothetical protein
VTQEAEEVDRVARRVEVKAQPSCACRGKVLEMALASQTY